MSDYDWSDPIERDRIESRIKGLEVENAKLVDMLDKRTLQHKVQLDSAVRLRGENAKLVDENIQLRIKHEDLRKRHEFLRG